MASSRARSTRAGRPFVSPRRGVTRTGNSLRNRGRLSAMHARVFGIPLGRRLTQQSARRALARGLSPARGTRHQRIARRAFPRSPRAMPAAAFLAFLRSVDGATDKDAPFFDGIAKALENNGLGNPSELAGCQYGDLDLGQSGALSASAKAHLRRALEKANAREVRRPRWFAGTRVALSAAEGGAECRERERAPGRPRAAPARVFAVGQ